MALYGVDISKWQAVGAGDNGKNFVICKATEGSSYVDPSCDKHYQRAKAQGKLRGSYHFARPDLNGGVAGARAEADWYVKNIQGYIRDGIMVLDWEKNVWDVAWAEAWLQRVHELTGIWPLIYMSASVVSSYNWSSVAKHSGLWIAGYPSKYNVKNPPTPSVNNMPYKLGAWSFWAIWQYSSSAGTLDRDIANMDAIAWAKYAGASTATVTTEKQQEVQIQPTAPEATEKPKEPEPTVEPSEPEKPQENASNEPTQETNAQVPEQPQATDTGFTIEEYNAIIEKAGKTVELVSEASKKFGVSIPMSNKVYDVLKVVAVLVLPLISFLFVGLANIWGFGFGEQVDKTIQLIISAVNAVLGMAIIKSSADYHKGD